MPLRDFMDAPKCIHAITLESMLKAAARQFTRCAGQHSAIHIIPNPLLAAEALEEGRKNGIELARRGSCSQHNPMIAASWWGRRFRLPGTTSERALPDNTAGALQPRKKLWLGPDREHRQRRRPLHRRPTRQARTTGRIVYRLARPAARKGAL